MFFNIHRLINRLRNPVYGEIWMLHRVRPNLTANEGICVYEITPGRLSNIIQTYLDAGYVFVSMNTVADIIRKSNFFVHKFVAVTLDDGYEDNYIYAYPIFKRFQIPFCIYIVKDYICGKKKPNEIVNFKMLSMEQLKILSTDMLCTIGCHTCSHDRLSEMTISEQKSEFELCKRWIDATLGVNVCHYAFPYGDYNSDSIQLMSKIGATTAVAAWGGVVRRKSSIYALPRIIVKEHSVH